MGGLRVRSSAQLRLRLEVKGISPERRKVPLQRGARYLPCTSLEVKGTSPER